MRRSPPLVETLARRGAIQEPVVVGVAEGLKAVDTGCVAGARALAGDIARRLHDLFETFAELIEQSGASGHRVP